MLLQKIKRRLIMEVYIAPNKLESKRTESQGIVRTGRPVKCIQVTCKDRTKPFQQLPFVAQMIFKPLKIPNSTCPPFTLRILRPQIKINGCSKVQDFLGFLGRQRYTVTQCQQKLHRRCTNQIMFVRSHDRTFNTCTW